MAEVLYTDALRRVSIARSWYLRWSWSCYTVLASLLQGIPQQRYLRSFSATPLETGGHPIIYRQSLLPFLRLPRVERGDCSDVTFASTHNQLNLRIKCLSLCQLRYSGLRGRFRTLILLTKAFTESIRHSFPPAVTKIFPTCNPLHHSAGAWHGAL